MRIRLLVGLIRCSKAVASALLAALATFPVFAFDLQAVAAQIAQEQQAKLQEGMNMMQWEWLQEAQAHSRQHDATVEKLTKQAEAATHGGQNLVPHAGQNRAENTLPPKQKLPYRTLLFASHSLGDASLRDLLVTASLDPEAVVVFRGIPDETQDVMSAMVLIHRLGRELDPPPNVILDPTLFRTHSITTVPTIVQLERVTTEQTDGPIAPTEVARVSGMTTTEWLQRQIAAGRRGDLGIRGPVAEIVERDLIEVMKERVLAIDWDAKKRAAQERYWRNQTFIALPVATNGNVRRIDAAVAAREDILTHDGKVVAKKGVKVNPLAIRKWTQALVIFNPTIESQWQRIGREIERLQQQPEIQKVVVIATEFDPESGWEGYNNAVNRLNLPLYQLTPDVQRRFAIRAVPSVVTADDTHFIVKEVGPIPGE